MIRKGSSVTLILTMFLFFSCEQGTKPNIILINVDDLGWKDVGFMGSEYYETPNLDRLRRLAIPMAYLESGI